jgi:nucleotide-binding universal stress UspA family protein
LDAAATGTEAATADAGTPTTTTATATTILVPHDGSETSDRALGFATKIAAKIGMQIALLYVVEELPLPLAKYSLRLPANRIAKENLEKLYAQIEKDAREFLEGKRKECEAAGVRAKVSVVRGKPVDRIMLAAEEEKAELVVMGSRGRAGVSRIRTIGSVARRALERLQCPVTLVH